MSRPTPFPPSDAPGWLKAFLPALLAATPVALTLLCLFQGAAPSYGQTSGRAGQPGPPAAQPAPRPARLEIPPGELKSCGATPSVVYEMNRRAYAARDDAAARARTGAPPQPASPGNQTPPGNFLPAQVVTCGKFRLYYDDFLKGPAGFNDANVGAARRNTLCAVLTYVENTLALNVNGTSDYIDLYIDQSWSAINPAPAGVGYLAIGGPYYAPNSGYGSTPGFYDGNAMLHATTGTDPDPAWYDGAILVNFDKFYVTVPTPGSVQTSYWDDYQNTAAGCATDLYSVLLHEVTHALGFLSSVKEDANFNAVCGVPGNSFTRFDDKFLYYYATNPCAGPPQKVVTGPQSSPSVNPAVSGQTNELRSNRVWLRNGAAAQNHPIYSGTLDPSFSPLAVDSVLSHMAGSPLSFTAMSQYAPGFQPNYVMGPSISPGQRKRVWTLAELRLLLTLGYGLNPAFGAGTTLDLALNGPPLTNASLLANNSPAYRTNCAPPQLSYWGPLNFMETLPADFTITNNNTPGSVTPQLTVNVAALGAADAQGDPVAVMPGTLFGIRGVSGNANDHAALSLNTSGGQIKYSPQPGFHGRAQFGFYLTDGHELGALRVVTVEVLPGGYVVPPGGQLVVNPGFEDGTEFRQHVQNPNIEHSPIVDWAYEVVFSGRNLSGAHPFNFVTNNWNLAGGDVMYNQWYACNWGMGPNPQNGAYGASMANWTTATLGTSFQHPTPVAAPAPNERYHHFHGANNYSTLANQVQGCNVYQFEADLNFQQTGWAAGQNFTFQLQFVNNPSPNYHTQVYYTVPVHVTVSAVAPHSWQHVTFAFQYCGAPTHFMNLLVQGLQNNPPPVLTGAGSTRGLSQTFQAAYYIPLYAPFIDNVSLKQVVPTPPLTLSLSAQPPAGSCPPTPVTLTGLPVNFIPCNATYTWQPGNLAGNAVTVTPTATTTYTMNVASTSCPQTASASVTVNVPPGNNVSTGWPKHPTGRPREFFNAAGVMPNGDIVVAGTFMINDVFPGFPVFTAGTGEHQIIVYRFSQTCGTVWAVTLGNPLKTETVNDLAVDAAGNIFLTGSVQQNTTFGTSGSGSGLGAYVLKLNGNTGAVLGAHISAHANAEGRAIALDAAGNVYVAGDFRATLQFGTLPTLSVTGWPSTQATTDLFVARFSNALAPVWSTSFGSPANDTAGGVAFTQGGAMYVAANIGGGAAVPQVAAVSAFSNFAAGPSQVFVGRFNNGTGAYVPSSGRLEGNAAADCAVRDMVAGGAGGGTVYFTGSFAGAFNTLTNPNQNAYVASWQWQGGALVNNWIRQMGGAGADAGRALGLDGAGNLYAAGDFVGLGTFPGFAPPSLAGLNPTSANVYVVRLSTGGAPAWAAASPRTSPGRRLTRSC